MLRFFALFMLIVIALFAVELLKPVQDGFVMPWTAMLAHISASPLRLFDPNVQVYGVVIRNIKNGIGVSIEPGCNGVEACIILMAAMLAFPAPWIYKLGGIAVGVLAVQAVNILRVISLFYLVQWNTAAFEFAHLYLWQALIMLDVLLVWLVWARFVARTSVPVAVQP
ncbi:MAG: exosortase H [Halothiobacillus sp.]